MCASEQIRITKPKFEKAVVKVFGDTETSANFSKLYEEYFYREILFTMCIYIFNYKIEEYSKEELFFMGEFISKYKDDATSHNDVHRLVNIFNE